MRSPLAAEVEEVNLFLCSLDIAEVLRPPVVEVGPVLISVTGENEILGFLCCLLCCNAVKIMKQKQT